MHLILFSLFIFSLSSFAYQSNLTGNGSKLRWANKNVSFAIRENSQTLAAPTSTQIIRNSVTEWNQSSSAKIVETPGAANEITFVQDFSIFGPGVVGLTELMFDEGSGTIQKARILLNENHFQFTSTPGLQANSTRVFLGDVVTHEMGHFFGLTHSEVLDSSMYFSTFPGQSSLAADDKAGVRNIYDTNYGKIYGHVKGGSQVGVLGVHVQAISLKTGESIGAISDAKGYFEIGGLDLNDSYYLYTSPLKKLDSLPGYFSNVQNSFCPASYVGSFFSACGKNNEGLPQKIHLSVTQSQVNVGTVTINCSLRANEDYSFEKLQSNFQPLTIWDSASQDQTQMAFTGYFRQDEISTHSFSGPDKLRIDLSHFLSVTGTTKYLQVRLVSQAFANPIEHAFDLKQNNVSRIGGPLIKSVRYPEGIFKTDLLAIVPLSLNVSENVFDLEIMGKKMPPEDLAMSIPAAGLYTSGQHFPYLLVVSIWESTSHGQKPYEDTEASLSDNKHCLDAPFTYAVSKATADQSKHSEKAEAAAMGAACGTLGPPQGGGPASSLPLLASGFLVAALLAQVMKSRKNFLS